MNEKKIEVVEDKISNASMLLNEIKSNYDGDKLYESNISFEQRHNDFKKLVIAIDILHDCQLEIEKHIEDIIEYNENFSEADVNRLETIRMLLNADGDCVKKCRTYAHVLSGKGGAES